MEETKKTLTINEVVRFLILFAGFWIKDGLVWQAAYVRSIFTDLSKFTFRPLVGQVVDEMVHDANRLITYYIMHERRSDVA